MKITRKTQQSNQKLRQSMSCNTSTINIDNRYVLCNYDCGMFCHYMVELCVFMYWIHNCCRASLCILLENSSMVRALSTVKQLPMAEIQAPTSSGSSK